MPWLTCQVCGKVVYTEHRQKIPGCCPACKKVWVYLEALRRSSIDRLGYVPKSESIGQGKRNYLD